MMHNLSSQLAQLEKEAHRKWITLAIAEENFLQQHSRVLWLNVGDLDTSFFHRMVATRRSTNQIHYLIDSHGNRKVLSNFSLLENTYVVNKIYQMGYRGV